MESERLLEFYQAMNNLPDAEASLASAVEQYLLSTNNPSAEILDSLGGLHEGLSNYSPENNTLLLFIKETRGMLADLSIAISGVFANEESLSRPLSLLADLNVACTAHGLINAAELISSIEDHLKDVSASRIPTLQALAVLESLIEDPGQERSVYEGIYAILKGDDTFEASDSSAQTTDPNSEPTETPSKPGVQDDVSPILTLNDDEHINPFIRSETAAQGILEQRILIVDDEETIAAMVGFILSDLDLPIDLVGDGAAALDRLNERPYSLVISDIEMPNFDGFSLIGAMRNDFQFSDVPLIFMSNKEAYRELALELGAKDFFLKGSIGGVELVEMISAVLETAPFVPQQDD